MKRILLALALLLILLITPTQLTYAQETANQSDDVYLVEIDSEDFTYSATKQEKVEAVIRNAFDSFKEEINLAEYKISVSDFNKICSNILNNDYRYFYVAGRSYNSSNGYVSYVDFYYSYDKTTADKMLKKYDAAISKALSGVDEDWTDMEKALYINDYIALNCEYD